MRDLGCAVRMTLLSNGFPTVTPNGYNPVDGFEARLECDILLYNYYHVAQLGDA